MRVVLLILDSMPHRMVNPTDTPNLWHQAQTGFHAPDGGRSLPISVTYSNHAAFLTGKDATETQLWGNWAWDGDDFVRTTDAGPRATTLFDRCRAAGKRSVAAVGDHLIVSAIGAQAANEVWPPTPVIPEGTPVDAYGYAKDEAVISAAREMDLDADLVVLHLNEPDTTLHVYGPESVQAAEQIRKSDAAYGEMVGLLAPLWDETLLITISDHDQEQITASHCVNLREAVAERGWNAKAAHEGTGAIVIGDVTAEQVLTIDGVEGATQADHQTVLAWTALGDMFGSGPVPTLGNHGSPRCQQQVAIVSGGHPLVGEVGPRIVAQPPTSLTWAPLIAELLGI